MQFKAFISYSHAVDGKLAPALQHGLQRFGKAWFQIRTMRVFRDQAVLSANPALWTSIERALEESEYFLLFASASAARSVWVEREVEWWLAHRTTKYLLILLTEGEVVWDHSVNDFDWTKTNALPLQLKRRFTQEPLYVDLRWARNVDQLSIRHLQFRGALLDIFATLVGRAKDELDSKEIRQHRRTMRVAWSAAASLLVLTLFSTGMTWFAFEQKAEANRQRDEVQLMNLTLQSELVKSQKKLNEFSACMKGEYDKALTPIRDPK